MIFRDRVQAGIELADKLRRYTGTSGVVLAVSPAGVPVSYMVAKELGLPMRLLLVKKIGHPKNRECTIGAVGLKGRYLLPYVGIGQHYIERETAQIRKRLQTMKATFEQQEERLSMGDKTVILVDDGIATGNTLLCVVNLLRMEYPAAIVLATPVASGAAQATLLRAVDDLVVLQTPELFTSVKGCYVDHESLSDEALLGYLITVPT